MLLIYTFSSYGATLSFVWSLVPVRLPNVRPKFTLFYLSFGAPPTSEGNIWLCSKCSAMFTRSFLTLSVCCLVCSKKCRFSLELFMLQTAASWIQKQHCKCSKSEPKQESRRLGSLTMTWNSLPRESDSFHTVTFLSHCHFIHCNDNINYSLWIKRFITMSLFIYSSSGWLINYCDIVPANRRKLAPQI